MLFLYMHADMLRSVRGWKLPSCREWRFTEPGSRADSEPHACSHMHVATCTCSLDMYVWYNVVYTLVVGIFDRFGTEEERGNP